MIEPTDEELLSIVKATLQNILSEYAGQTLTPYVIENIRDAFINQIKDK